MNSEEILYFNGIKAATGKPGLRPQTVEDLNAHLKGETRVSADSDREVLERKLARDRHMAEKITAIVRLLAEQSVTDAHRDEAWHERWLTTLAKTLAEAILGPSYTKPEQLDALKYRLRHHTLDKLVKITEHLVKGEAAALAKLLLVDQDEEPENFQALKDRLKQDAEDKFLDMHENLFTEDTLQTLATEAETRRAWIDDLMTHLAHVPITPLRALGYTESAIGEDKFRYVISTPLKSLVNGLKSSSFSELIALATKLEAEDMGTWDGLLAVLQDGLKDLRDGSAALWQTLFDALDKWREAMRDYVSHLGLIEGINPMDLSEAGWGVIFPYEDPHSEHPKVPLIKEKLKPLLDLRKQQAGERYHEYEGENGYLFNDAAAAFITRQGANVSDPVNPEKVPYYLLIVGSPEEIPFHFQYQLDVQYAVGRIYFDERADTDHPFETYAHYARSVVAAEREAGTQPACETEGLPQLKATFFGVSHDEATRKSAEHLVAPLVTRFEAKGDMLDAPWDIVSVMRDAATKEALYDLMRGKTRPAFLFTASHGVEFDKDDPETQRRTQGAILCQNWKGGKVLPDAYLSANDFTEEDNLAGLIAFFFACYGAGTPRYDAYSKQVFKRKRETIADEPFIAGLPAAMLSRPKGGALAVIGHVERAWSASFLGEAQHEHVEVFESMIERLLKGYRVGYAMEYFNARYAALSTELTAIIDSWELSPSPREMAEKWLANNDARGYIVIGDPAVRLPVVKNPPEAFKRTADASSEADDFWF